MTWVFDLLVWMCLKSRFSVLSIALAPRDCSTESLACMFFPSPNTTCPIYTTASLWRMDTSLSWNHLPPIWNQRYSCAPASTSIVPGRFLEHRAPWPVNLHKGTTEEWETKKQTVQWRSSLSAAVHKIRGVGWSENEAVCSMWQFASWVGGWKFKIQECRRHSIKISTDIFWEMGQWKQHPWSARARRSPGQAWSEKCGRRSCV